MWLTPESLNNIVAKGKLLPTSISEVGLVYIFLFLKMHFENGPAASRYILNTFL
jgi:hypothetical protein